MVSCVPAILLRPEHVVQTGEHEWCVEASDIQWSPNTLSTPRPFIMKSAISGHEVEMYYFKHQRDADGDITYWVFSFICPITGNSKKMKIWND